MVGVTGWARVIGHRKLREEVEVQVSPPSLRTPRLGAQGMGSQAQCGAVVSGGHPDQPGCLQPSTAAAELMLYPGERRGLVTPKRENAGGL